jgi:maleylacetate reductase
VRAAPDFVAEQCPQRVVFGTGRRSQLASELDALGATAVLVVGGGHDRAAVDELVATLGSRPVRRIADVHQHVPRLDVDAARAVVDDSEIDTVVTVGGGSATGLGKALALHAPIRLVAIPTTYSGSERTSIWGVSDGTRKQTGRDPRVRPAVVIYDPELTLGLPPSVTAASAFNALAHCVESLWVPERNPGTTSVASDAIRVIVDVLGAVIADPGDIVARSWLLYGSYRAGEVLDATGTALHHRAAHVLGGQFGLDHAGMNSALLPHVVAYNTGWGSWDPTELEAAVRGQPAARLFELAQAVGAPTSLSQLGMPADGIDAAVDEIIVAVGDRNPRTPDPDSLGEMLSQAWEGAAPAPRR